MRKAIYLFAFIITISLGISSCTEEPVKPAETCGCQGSGSNDKGW